MTTAMSSIRWRQVLSLAAVQAVISLMWVVYNAYLPDLFGEIGLPTDAIALLLLVEAALAIAIHPLAGSLSDRSLHWLGTRFPIISVGVIASSALFILIPLLAIAGGQGLRWTIVFVLVAWAIAMTLFHSPIISLLFIYSSVPQLPLVASTLILTQRLVSIAKPAVEQALLNLGASITFTVGSIALLGAAVALRQVTPPDAPVTKPRFPALSSLALIGFLGVGIGWGTRLVMGNLPKLMLDHGAMADLSGDRLMLWVAIGLAVLTVPAGWLASTIGNRPVLLVSLAATIALSLLMVIPVLAVQGICTVLLAVTLSGVFNGAFPFAITHVPSERVGLGIGMYLAGLSAAFVSFNRILPEPQFLPPLAGAGIGAIALAVAILAVWFTPKPGTAPASKEE